MSDERRRSFRLALPAGQEQAVLRVGRREFDIRLVNTSATGFALLSPEPVKAAAGQQLQLQTVAGWSEVRVAWAAAFEEGEVLGVERIQDLDRPPPPLESRWAKGALVVSIVALALGAGAMFYYWSLDEAERESQSPRQLIESLLVGR